MNTNMDAFIMFDLLKPADELIERICANVWHWLLLYEFVRVYSL